MDSLKVLLTLLGCVATSYLVNGQECKQFNTNPYTKIWNIAVGHDYGAHEYINEGGYLTGFTYDMIDAVCSAAGINCRTIWGKYSNCWESAPGQHAYGGKGLLGRWYDACAGWYTTIDRIHVFDFSMNWLNPPKAYFFVKKGNTFDSSNLTGKKIGFIQSWASDEKCVARQTQLTGHFLLNSQIIYAADPAGLADMLDKNTIDAGFSTIETMDPYVKAGTVTQLTDKDFQCMISGNAMMTRKDNDFIHYWNTGFMKIRNNGKFKALCQKGTEAHKQVGTIDCVST